MISPLAILGGGCSGKGEKLNTRQSQMHSFRYISLLFLELEEVYLTSPVQISSTAGKLCYSNKGRKMMKFMAGPSLVAGAVDHLSEQRGSASGRHVDEGEAAVARVAHL